MHFVQAHFEESQFELKRQDGKLLLKWNAVPTLFDVPNKPKPVTLRRPNPLERKRTLAALLDDVAEPDDISVCSAAVKLPRTDHEYCRGLSNKPTVVHQRTHADHAYASVVISHVTHGNYKIFVTFHIKSTVNFSKMHFLN